MLGMLGGGGESVGCSTVGNQGARARVILVLRESRLSSQPLTMPGPWIILFLGGLSPVGFHTSDCLPILCREGD